MITVGDVVRRLLPSGTVPPARLRNGPAWRECPFWPPDLFAVAATLASEGGIYARPRYAPQLDPAALFSAAVVAEITHRGARWRERGAPPAAVRAAWRALWAAAALPLRRLPEAVEDLIMSLLVTADEAAMGMGFAPTLGPDGQPDWCSDMARALWASYDLKLHPSMRASLRHVPTSICFLVPPTEACVQPKTMAAQVGVTLRCFSHHLALLPPLGEVETQWLPTAAPRAGDADDAAHLNLLMLPFPYQVPGNVFRAHGCSSHPGFRYFDVEPTWLTRSGRRVSAGQLCRDMFLPLLAAARNEVGPIHGVVLPELALTERLAIAVARQLAREGDLELFVSGVLSGSERAPENGAYVALLRDRRIFAHWLQAKHHRWALDRSQIVRYHLGHALRVAREDGQWLRWWERIDVQRRKVMFYPFRQGASLAVLICEDLARVDPVQSVIRAVGPNLVIALLMDGPQLATRWPARYATVLADDPGSAVLTLTSLGMVRRSAMPGTPPRRVVALWKSGGDDALELTVPSDAHALVATLSCHREEQWTLDQRRDHETTVRLSLTAVRPIRVVEPKALTWLEPVQARW